MPVAVDQISLPDFAKSIKDKYPQYKNIPDTDLVKSVIEKYPQYKGRVKMDQSAAPPAAPPSTTPAPKSEMMSADISKYTNVKAPSEKQPVGEPKVYSDQSSIIPDSEAIKIRTEDAANRTTDIVNKHLDKTLTAINNNASDKAYKDLSIKHGLGDISEEDYQKATDAYMKEVLLNRDQRLKEAKDLMNKDPQYQAKVIQRIADDNPKAAKQLKADQYVLSAQNRPDKASTIIQNAREIENGNQDFSIEHNQLIKNLDFAQSVAAGYHERNKALADYDFYNGASDEDAIKHLDEKINSYDPDKPQEVPGGLGSAIGGQGILMAKGVGAAAGASLIGAEAAAPWAAAAATSPEIYKTSYANSLERNYADILNTNENISKQDAYKQAKDRASFDAKADVAAGIAMTVTGTKIGFKALKPSELSPGFINIAKNIAKHVAGTSAEGATAGVAAGGAEALKNLHTGKPIGENVEGAVTGQLLFAYGTAGLTHAAKAFITPKTRETIVQNVAKAPEETVNKTLADLVSHGKVSPEEANSIHSEIELQRQKDSKIPSNVKSDQARANISKMLDKRDQLEVRLENQAKPFHEETKLKIEALDEKIKAAANEGKQHDENPEIELPFPEAEKESKVSVVRPEENTQPNVVPLKTEDHAIQEPEPSSVLQHPQSGTGETGGERGRVEPSIEGQKAPEKGEVKGEEKINQLNREREDKIAQITKPSVEPEYLSDDELAKGIKGSGDFVKRQSEQKAIQDKFDNLKQVIDCLWP